MSSPKPRPLRDASNLQLSATSFEHSKSSHQLPSANNTNAEQFYTENNMSNPILQEYFQVSSRDKPQNVLSRLNYPRTNLFSNLHYITSNKASAMLAKPTMANNFSHQELPRPSANEKVSNVTEGRDSGGSLLSDTRQTSMIIKTPMPASIDLSKERQGILQLVNASSLKRIHSNAEFQQSPQLQHVMSSQNYSNNSSGQLFGRKASHDPSPQTSAQLYQPLIQPYPQSLHTLRPQPLAQTSPRDFGQYFNTTASSSAFPAY